MVLSAINSINRNDLDITTIFALNDTSTKVEIIYLCAVSDYYDLEVVAKTLWPTLAALQLEPLRQEFAIRLCNPNNTHSIKCFHNIICPQNSLCNGENIKLQTKYIPRDDIVNGCANQNAKPEVSWKNDYLSYRQKLMDSLVLNCNNPTCSSAYSLY